MFDPFRRRLAAGKREGGFTLIELLLVLIILAILVTMAFPTYVGFKSRAQRRTAQANLRAAVPAVETYFADNETYAGMDLDRAATDRRERQEQRHERRVRRLGNGRRLLRAISQCRLHLLQGRPRGAHHDRGVRVARTRSGIDRGPPFERRRASPGGSPGRPSTCVSSPADSLPIGVV